MNEMKNVLDRELNICLQQLNEAEKKSVLLMLKTFLKGRSDETDRISIEQYNREIDEALAEVETGDFISQEEMEKKTAKW